MNPHPPLVAILGPTAVGKTEISLRIAGPLEAEIISADSRSLYRGMDIGTAKPTKEERARVRHHLIDVADPEETWSLARYRRAALGAIDDIHRRGKLPMLVGGTGQYLTALLQGWRPPPKPPEEGVREELEALAEEHGAEALHHRLAEVDPASADRIHPANLRRVVRALEIYRTTGRPASELRRSEPPSFRSLRVGLWLPREELYERIDRRIDAMMDQGLIREVERLLARGYGPGLPAMSAIGYKQLAGYLQGDLTLEEAVAQMRRRSRQFVRHQDTWFRNKIQEIHWFEARSGVEGEILSLVRSWLKSGAE